MNIHGVGWSVRVRSVLCAPGEHARHELSACARERVFAIKSCGVGVLCLYYY